MKEQGVQIKSITDEYVTLGGYAVVFGNEESLDLDGEYFTKETDFWLDVYKGSKPLLVEHAPAVIGEVKRLTADEIGLQIEAVMPRHAEYVEMLLQFAKDGYLENLGWSSGAVSHLVERFGKHITSWPIAEVSLTSRPAEFRTLGAEIIGKIFAAAGLETPEEFAKAEEVEADSVRDDEGKAKYIIAATIAAWLARKGKS